MIIGLLGLFWAENGTGGAREVFKKLPGCRSSVLTEYERVGSHGDLIRGQN